MKPKENSAPTPDEIRKALRHILASPVFSHAAQLGAFLRFVVETALAGDSGYIKSYTIGVEALGRSESFDPKVDPIVRVEAGRVRRALSRYYATGDAVHAVIIELPLGGYVPVFRRPARLRGVVALLAGLRHRVGGHVRLTLEVAAFVVVVVAAGIVIAMMQGPQGVGDRREMTGTVNPLSGRAATEVPSSPILPTVIVQPFDMIGASPQQAAELDAIRSRLRDALARFDEIAVADDGALQSGQVVVGSTYRLAGLGEFRKDGDLTLSLWLTDADVGTIAWSESFEVGAAGARSAVSRIVQQVATKLAQPYGVVYAREAADAHVDRRYRCVIDAFEYRRGFRRAAVSEVDVCLERITTENPTFAAGFALQALRELQRYYDWQGDRALLLERAVMLAQKAVDLKPHSARARQALMSALFARREINAALSEGEVAVSLNPNDMIALHAYGMLLLFAGQADKGALLVRQAAAMSPVRPAMFEFTMFLSAYLLDDNEKATNVARLFTNNDYPLLLVARVVAAARTGDIEQSRRAVERLMTVHPAWRDNARQRLERYFPSKDIVDRLTGDLERAGLFATQ